MHISLTWAATFTRKPPLPPEQYAFRCTRQQLGDSTHTDTSNNAAKSQIKVSHIQIPQTITSQNKSILSSSFLFSAIAVNSTLAQHSQVLFSCVSNSLHLQHVRIRYQEQELALMKAQSLLPFLLLLPCLTSGLYKILPPASMQHIASICTFQSLFILIFFLSLFLSF